MLGSAILDVFEERAIPVTATSRDLQNVPARWRDQFAVFDAAGGELSGLLRDFGEGDFVINCIGVIKHHIDDQNVADRQWAISINAQFPYHLTQIAEHQGFHVIQIATDCVFSGQRGEYDEDAAHDAVDVYGQTKSLGEVPSPTFLNLRCSIIGPELKNRVSLLEWVLAHEPGSSFSGFTDHRWNGVTARAFGRVVAGIVESGNFLAGTFHLVPEDAVTKHELSKMILGAYGRDMVEVVATETGSPINRTLSTRHSDVGSRLWRDAGYGDPPRIQHLLQELADNQSHPLGESK